MSAYRPIDRGDVAVRASALVVAIGVIIDLSLIGNGRGMAKR